MPAAGFEPTISAGERPQTYALDRATIGTGRTSVSSKDCFIVAEEALYSVAKYCCLERAIAEYW
jgi:hypothetical protein